jgi:hypothetical protein
VALGRPHLAADTAAYRPPGAPNARLQVRTEAGLLIKDETVVPIPVLGLVPEWRSAPVWCRQHHHGETDCLARRSVTCHWPVEQAASRAQTGMPVAVYVNLLERNSTKTAEGGRDERERDPGRGRVERTAQPPAA